MNPTWIFFAGLPNLSLSSSLPRIFISFLYSSQHPSRIFSRWLAGWLVVSVLALERFKSAYIVRVSRLNPSWIRIHTNTQPNVCMVFFRLVFIHSFRFWFCRGTFNRSENLWCFFFTRSYCRKNVCVVYVWMFFGNKTFENRIVTVFCAYRPMADLSAYDVFSFPPFVKLFPQSFTLHH